MALKAGINLTTAITTKERIVKRVVILLLKLSTNNVEKVMRKIETVSKINFGDFLKKSEM